jgi:ribonuclease P protein component
MISLPNDKEWNCYAVVVGKKIEKSAAKRNRKRRQINEAIRLLEQAKPVSSGPHSDIVVLVRHAGLTASFEELKTALSTLV